ncbi:tetrahydrofolate synthase [Segatella salivae]|uniref:tetrahydrofolate synthase n=1 Tax=Segatella salivae TaxID=228604 RepID=UPI00248F03DB|nr:tetrahydrofolate synthase [Segatella salivae]
MNEFIMMNVVTIQHRMCYVGIPMNVFGIMNVTTIQHRIFFAGILMNIFCNINALMVQLGTSCSFDSPGLARNEPTPGKHPQGDSTP